MVRLNLLLLSILVLCALSVVNAQHRARKLYQSLEKEQVRAQQLNVEYGQLQIEMSTWATNPRVESIARDRLKMVAPQPVAKRQIQQAPMPVGDE